jgi:hypothetical protein
LRRLRPRRARTVHRRHSRTLPPSSAEQFGRDALILGACLLRAFTRRFSGQPADPAAVRTLMHGLQPAALTHATDAVR